MLTATVTISLDHDFDDLDHADRRALQDLHHIPDGARLVVVVGDRSILMPSAIGWLARSAERLDVEICASTPRTARRWYDAIKSGFVE